MLRTMQLSPGTVSDEFLPFGRQRFPSSHLFSIQRAWLGELAVGRAKHSVLGQLGQDRHEVHVQSHSQSSKVEGLSEGSLWWEGVNPCN